VNNTVEKIKELGPYEDYKKLAFSFSEISRETNE